MTSRLNKQLSDQETFKYSMENTFFQLVVGSGETIIIEGRFDNTAPYTVIGSFTESKWIKAEALPPVELRFTIPAGSSAYIAS